MSSSIHTDSFFTIGSNHQICQDYATHSENIVALSDGCSTAKHTDIGARLFCLEALKSINVYDITLDGLTKLRGLGLNKQAGLATILYVFSNGEDIISVIWGDGIIAWRHHNGDLRIIEHRYSGNAPYYPAYKYIDKGELHYTYLSLFQRTQKFFIGDEELPLDNYGTVPHSSAWLDAKVVAIFSDGVGSFMNDKGERLPVNEVVTRLMDFNEDALAGEFVKRRCIKVIKDLKKQGYIPYDDVSMAAIYKTRSED